MPARHLRVVHRLLVVEDLGAFVCPKWLFLGVQETGGVAFFPDPFVPVVLRVAGDDHRSERLGRAQHDGRFGFGDSQVLTPEWFERDDHVPGALGRTVGQVGQHHVDTVVRDGLHHLEAIAQVQPGVHGHK
ncbi:hypothetical protein D3C71_1724740 [compost metagenome]